MLGRELGDQAVVPGFQLVSPVKNELDVLAVDDDPGSAADPIGRDGLSTWHLDVA
jgi:hypothetical protein